MQQLRRAVRAMGGPLQCLRQLEYLDRDIDGPGEKRDVRLDRSFPGAIAFRGGDGTTPTHVVRITGAGSRTGGRSCAWVDGAHRRRSRDW